MSSGPPGLKLGTLRNYDDDGDGNGNVKKPIGLMTKKIFACASRFFVHFFAVSL